MSYKVLKMISAVEAEVVAEVETVKEAREIIIKIGYMNGVHGVVTGEMKNLNYKERMALAGIEA